MGSIIASSLGEGMFHDLLTWFIFTGAIVAVRYQFGFNLKLIACGAFIFLAVTIQLLKVGYRAATGSGQADTGLETFSELYTDGVDLR